jgi:hypothetical protein
MLNSQLFVLAAAGAEQHQRDFSGSLIKLRRKPQPVRAAIFTLIFTLSFVLAACSSALQRFIHLFWSNSGFHVPSGL